MFKSVRVGSILGIPLRLDVTFLIVVPAFTFIIGSEIEMLVGALSPLVPGGLEAAPLATGVLPWALGLTAALGLFASVAVHELGHSVVAMHYGYRIDSITLWLLGGLAKLTETPRYWFHEFAIAVAGPLVSVGLGLAVAVPLLSLELPAVVGFVLAYLAVMNIALAAFNLLPAFPMDGGRVLRALLSRNRSLSRATTLAAEVGKAVAVLLGLWGLFVFNPVLIGIAGFIYISASGEARRVLMEDALGDVAVASVMRPLSAVRLVGPAVTVSTLERRMATEGQSVYPVVRGTRPVGLVDAAAVSAVPDGERSNVTVGEIMDDDPPTVSLEADAMATLSHLRSSAADVALVVDDGLLAGVLDLADARGTVEGLASGWNARRIRPEAHRD